MAMFHVVLNRSGPQWEPHRPLEEQSGWAESEEAVRSTLARDPWSESHLRVDAIEPWTIRLDGRRG